jgi:hypothetical protein
MVLPIALSAAREDSYARQLARRLGLANCARL